MSNAIQKTAPGHRPSNPRTEQLLTAIEDWIADVGVVDFSLRSAAKAAGVSAPALVQHFGSRDGLLQALLQHRADFHIEGLRSALEQCGSIRKMLRQAAEPYSEADLRDLRLDIHLRGLAQSADRSLSESLRQIREQGITEIASVIEAEGVRASYARAVAHFLVTASAGSSSDFAMHRNLEALNDDRRMLNRSVLFLIDDACGEDRT